jgi:mono/diheme cytochrome c family protein
MWKFVAGFAAAAVLIALAAFSYVRLGFFDPRADIAVGTLESRVAMPALDAAVDRRAEDTKNPLQPSEANLIAGAKIYQADCASCHGDIRRTHAQLADSLYPRAPQFLEDAPDMPENQNYYIVEHGIRLTGMPAWKQVLSPQEMWQVTTLLSHMDKLPPQVSDAWKTMAAAEPVSGALHSQPGNTLQADAKMPPH